MTGPLVRVPWSVNTDVPSPDKAGPASVPCQRPGSSVDTEGEAAPGNSTRLLSAACAQHLLVQSSCAHRRRTAMIVYAGARPSAERRGLELMGRRVSGGASGRSGPPEAGGADVPHLASLRLARFHFGPASAWLLLVRPAAQGNAPNAVCRVPITSHKARDLVGPRPQFAPVPRPRRPSRTPHRPCASSLIATAVGVAVDGSHSERRWVRGLKAVRACARPSKE